MIQAQMNQTLTTATFTPDVFAIYREVVSEDLIDPVISSMADYFLMGKDDCQVFIYKDGLLLIVR